MPVQIKELESEIARLRAEIDAKSAEIIELQTELHRLRPIADQVDDLRAQLAEANSGSELVSRQLMVACGKVNDLEAAARRGTEDIARLRHWLKWALHEIVEYNGDYQEEAYAALAPRSEGIDQMAPLESERPMTPWATEG